MTVAAGGGAFGHMDGPMPGAVSCHRSGRVWLRACHLGDVSLAAGVIKCAKTFPKDAGVINALCLPAFFENNMILIAGEGAFSPIGGPKPGAVSYRQDCFQAAAEEVELEEERISPILLCVILV